MSEDKQPTTAEMDALLARVKKSLAELGNKIAASGLVRARYSSGLE